MESLERDKWKDSQHQEMKDPSDDSISGTCGTVGVWRNDSAAGQCHGHIEARPKLKVSKEE